MYAGADDDRIEYIVDLRGLAIDDPGENSVHEAGLNPVIMMGSHTSLPAISGWC